MNPISAKVASRRVRKIEDNGVSWNTTLSLYWFGNRHRNADTAQRIRAGTRSWGSTAQSGAANELAEEVEVGKRADLQQPEEGREVAEHRWAKSIARRSASCSRSSSPALRGRASPTAPGGSQGHPSLRGAVR